MAMGNTAMRDRAFPAMLDVLESGDLTTLTSP
jgi:hypothetical protein